MNDVTELITALVAIAKDPKAWEKRIDDMKQVAGDLKEARKIKADAEAAQKAAAADLETARYERDQAERTRRDVTAQAAANDVRGRELEKREHDVVAKEQWVATNASNLKNNQDAREADLEMRERLAAKKLNDAQKILASYDEAKHKALQQLAS